jgi:hypothetical protein
MFLLCQVEIMSPKSSPRESKTLRVNDGPDFCLSSENTQRIFSQKMEFISTYTDDEKIGSTKSPEVTQEVVRRLEKIRNEEISKYLKSYVESLPDLEDGEVLATPKLDQRPPPPNYPPPPRPSQQTTTEDLRGRPRVNSEFGHVSNDRRDRSHSRERTMGHETQNKRDRSRSRGCNVNRGKRDKDRWEIRNSYNLEVSETSFHIKRDGDVYCGNLRVMYAGDICVRCGRVGHNLFMCEANIDRFGNILPVNRLFKKVRQ